MLPELVSTLLAQPLVDTAPASSSTLEAILKYLVAPLIPLVGGALVWALKALVSFLNTRKDESKVAGVSLAFAELAQSVVIELETTMRPQLQKALADGKLSPEEGAALKTEALRILKEKAPAGLMSAASAVFGGALDTWLGGLVERANVKMDTAAKAAEANP